MATFDDMFNEEMQKYGSQSEPTIYDKAVEEARREFAGSEDNVKSEREIKAKLTDLRAKLRSNRNVKVASATKINSERAEKRKRIRAQINELELALKNLELEKKVDAEVASRFASC